jgi:hypothetical protein
VWQSVLFQKISKLVVAMLFAVIAAAVYHSFVVSQFEPIRVDVVSVERHSADGVVTVTLPDLSTLRGHRVVLGMGLRNTGDDERQIGLFLDGFPVNRVVLPLERTISWQIALSPGNLRALTPGVGHSPRSLELRGDGDGWTLTALDLRNYHVRLKGGLVTVLPGRADLYRSGTALLPAAIVLSLLALVQALGPRRQSRSRRLLGEGAALAAFLVCVICLILPRISPYKVLLSRFAFSLIVAGLFLPVLLHTERPLVAAMRSISRTLAAMFVVAAGAMTRLFAIATDFRNRHPVTFERGASLFALCAIGIAQPIFAVVSNSPEFFASRSTAPATAAAAVIGLCLGIPLVLLGIERAIGRGSEWAAAAFHGTVLALLSAAVVRPWFRRVEVVISPWDVLLSVLAGLAVALAFARVRLVRQFFTALSPAALVVPALFLLDPAVVRTFLPSESPAALHTIERTPPIVLVVFDELPLNSLLDADGTIDAGRYPNFAALARDAYWFRNASTVSSETVWAVPAILSGRYPTAGHAVPTLRYYPVNLFTALGRHYDIFASLRFQKLCPVRACQYNSAMPADTFRSLLWDFGVVWLHIVLPQALTEALPPVTGDWAEFGQPGTVRQGEIRNGRAGVFAEFLSSIDGQPARLHFIHLLLPHMAFEYVASGRQYRAPDYQTRRLFERVSPAYADTLHQRHLAQVGFVDRLVGDLVARLREVGAYDKALVIITADHGASYREGHARREPQQHNLSEILQVPLLMKLPGQRHGEVVDRIVETVDILPTILDVLAAKVPLRLDGRSLVGDRAAERSSRTFILRDRSTVVSRAVKDSPADRAASLDRKLRRFGSGDLTGLYAPPGARHMLGVNVSRSPIHQAPDVRITIHNPERFTAVDRDRDPLPLYVRGVLSTSRSDPLTVAVVVNGIVAAVSESYREGGGHVFGTLIPETSLQDGNNSVTAFVLDGLSTPSAPSRTHAPRTP